MFDFFSLHGFYFNCCSEVAMLFSFFSVATIRRWPYPLSLFAGTPSYIGDLVLAVPVVHLSCGNLGKLWGKLKVNTKECPPWEKLKDALFWKDAVLYQRVWDLLAGEVKRPSGHIQGPVNTESGSVETASFEFTQDGKPVTKVAAWGTMEALSDHRKIHLVWWEVGSEGLPTTIGPVLEKHRDACLILVGPESGIIKAVRQVSDLTNERHCLWQYKASLMSLFLREDPPLGARVLPHANVLRKVLLCSPNALRVHRNYIALDYPW